MAQIVVVRWLSFLRVWGSGVLASTRTAFSLGGFGETGALTPGAGFFGVEAVVSIKSIPRKDSRPRRATTYRRFRALLPGMADLC